jgi:putative glutamine amidotransferase
MLNTDRIKVNSYHHQGIKRISDKFMPAARAEDGLIEAIFMADKKFIMAVQWHPEFIYKSDEMNAKIFEEFVGACKR